MYEIIRPLLFRLDPERAHTLTLRALQFTQVSPISAILHRIYGAPTKPVLVFGLEFPNPVGLAAGYDKDGQAWRGLASLGFGHVEIGTVTLRPQPGNPKPRLFRLRAEEALINRMGFPGRGAQYVADRLGGPRPPGLVLGVNMGKNKDTPLEDAAGDYQELLRIFAPLGDYLVINVSSPNTVGLRRLQARNALEELLQVLSEERGLQETRLKKSVPLLVKLSPDLQPDELEDALAVIDSKGMDGVIATNTTLSRDGIGATLAGESGGMSGRPLFKQSYSMVAQISLLTKGRLPVVGVGGIMGPAEARAMLEAGASLVQVYTGLVYKGPGLVKQILSGL